MIIKNKKKFLILLSIFSLVQPLLNILIHFYNGSYLSLLLIVTRPLFMGYLWLEILFNKQFDKKTKIFSFILLALFGIYSFIHLVNIKEYFFIDSVGNIFDEVKQLFTYLYFILTTFVIYMLYSLLNNKERNIFFKIITITAFIVCLLMIISIISGTSLRSYENNLFKLGWKGWSTSAHYVGNVVVLVFPIILSSLFEKKLFKSKIMKYILLIIIIIAPYFLLGTKTPTLLILAYMLFYSFIKSINILRMKTKFKDVAGIFLITIILITTFSSTYAYRNMIKQINNIGDKKVGNLGKVFDKIEKDPIIDKIPSLKKKEFQIRIEKILFDVKNISFKTYDNRQVQIFINSNIYKQSSFMDRTFGYGWNTLPRVIWVEADLFFIFFSFGIVALVLIMLFPIILLIKTWINYFKNIKKLNPTSWLLFAASAINFMIILFIGFTIIYAQTSFYYIILMIVAYYDSDSYNKKLKDDKKRYLFMINDMTTGGAEVGLVDVINELVKKDNVEIDLLLLRKRGELLDRIDSRVNILSLYQTGNNIFYKFINLFIKILYFGGNATNKLLYSIIIDKKYTAEIAYIEGYPAIFLSNSTNKDSIKIGSIRVGLKNHKLHIEKIPNGLKRLENAYKKLDYIHCVSKETANEFMERFPGNDDKIQVYYTYFNISEINKKGKEIINDFDKNKFNIVAVGRFDEQKGYERLIEAIKDINKKDINLYFIGKNDSLYGNKMKELVNQYQLSNIYFLGVKTNPYPYIKQADMLVSSSHYEGYPRVINEALCLKQICVATNVTGTKEALQDGKLGLLVDNSVEGIVKGILKVYNNDKVLIDIKKSINTFDGNKKQFFEGFDYMTNKTNNLRCLFITDIYPYNGEGFVNNEMKYASKKFKNIDIITTKPNSKEYAYDLPANVKVYHLNKFNLLYLFSNLDFQKEALKEFFKSLKHKRRFIIWGKNYYYSAVIKAKILQLSKKRNYDVFFSYWFHWSSLAIVRTNSNALKIAKSHSYDLYEAANPQLYKKYILSRLSGVYPISKAGYNELKNQLGMKNIKTYFLGTYNDNTLDFNKFKNNKNITIVSVSRMAPVKRIHLIVEILASLDLKINWIHFGDGELMPEIKKLASEKLDKKRNITYELKGYVRNDDIINYYNNNYYNIDLFINTSSQEGIPVTIMESTSYGIIPLAGDVGGNREIVTKYLVKNGQDEKTIIEEMVKIINNYAKMSLKEKIDLKKEVYNIWDKKFNANINNQKFYTKEILNKLK